MVDSDFVVAHISVLAASTLESKKRNCSLLLLVLYRLPPSAEVLVPVLTFAAANTSSLESPIYLPTDWGLFFSTLFCWNYRRLFIVLGLSALLSCVFLSFLLPCSCLLYSPCGCSLLSSVITVCDSKHVWVWLFPGI